MEPDGGRPIPRGARWLVHLYLAAIGLAVVAGSAAALVRAYELRVLQHSLESFSALYMRINFLHPVLMTQGVIVPGGLLVLSNLVISAATRPARSPLLPLGFIGLLAWLVAISLAVLPLVALWPVPELLAIWRVAGVMIAASHAVTLVHLVAMLDTRRLGPTGWLATAGSVGALSGACLLCAIGLAQGATPADAGMMMLSRAGGLSLIAACSVLPYLVERIAGNWPGRPWRAAVAVALTTLPTLLTHAILAVAALVGWLYLAISILRAALASSARTTAPILFLALGVVPALLLFAPACAVLWLIDPEAHLHDTYFTTACGHLLGAAVLGSLLGAVHAFWAELTSRTYALGLARAAAVLFGSGTVITAIAMIIAGVRGLPRNTGHLRLADFEWLHRVIAIGGLLSAVGCLLAIVGLFRGARMIAPHHSETARVFE
jgi:hypothetical protein